MSKLLFLIKYIHYFFISKTKHSVHSPFVYDLVTKVLNDKSHKEEYAELIKSKDTNIGSKYIKLIIRLISYLKLKNILEIGNSEQLNSKFLKHIQKNTAVFYYDITTNKTLENFNPNEKLPNKFDLLFFNTKDEYRLTLSKFMNLQKYLHNNTVSIINNIRQSKEMENVWKEIISQKEVTVSIDLFFIGLVFFRKEQVKENFIIRF